MVNLLCAVLQTKMTAAISNGGYCIGCKYGVSFPYWACKGCKLKFCGVICIESTLAFHDQCDGEIYEKFGPENFENSKTANVPCKFYALGKCRRDVCDFRHMRSKVECKYFQQGNCKFGKDCANIHPGENTYAAKLTEEPTKPYPDEKPVIKEKEKRPPVVCVHFQLGRCEYGATCWKQHDMPVFPDYTPPLPSTGHLSKPFVLQASAKIQNNGATAQILAKEDGDTELVLEVPLKQVCTHFQVGTCVYGDNCLKTHEKLPLYKKDLTNPLIFRKKIVAEPQFNEWSSSEDEEIFLSSDESVYTSDHEDSQGSEMNNNEDNVNSNNNKNTNKPENQVQTRKTQKKKVVVPDNPFELLQNNVLPSSSEEEESETEPGVEELEEELDIKEIEETKPETKKERREKKKARKKDQVRIIVDNLRYEGNNQYSRGCYEKAITLYSNAIQKAGPNNPCTNLYNNRAAAFMMNCKYRASYNDIKKVLELDSTNTKALVRLMKVCLVLGFYKEGSVGARHAGKQEKAEYEKNFKTIEHCYKEAIKCIEADKYSKAESFIDKAKKLCFQSVEFSLLKASVLVLQKKLIPAKKIISSQDLKDPAVKCCWYYFAQGVLHYYENDLTRSLSRFTEAKKSVTKAIVTKAIEWHEKVSHMKQLLESGNRNLEKNNKNYTAAIDLFFNVALKVGVDNSKYMYEVYKSRATAFAELNDYMPAINDLTAAMEIDKSDFQIWLTRGKLQYKCEMHQEALEDLNKARELGGGKEALSMIEKVKAAIKQLDMQGNYYEILGVSRDVKDNKLRQAFHIKAKKFHPDKHANANPAEKKVMEEKMKEIARAYDVLSDKQKRKEYDWKLDNGDSDSDNEWESYDSDEEMFFSAEEFFAFLYSTRMFDFEQMFMGSGRRRGYRY